MIWIMKPLPQPLDQLHRRHLSTQTLQRGETLFVQDAATAGLYFLSAGTIDLTRSTTTGHHVLIHRARSGDTFADASLFSTHYHCTATASTEASVIACARSAIDELLATDIDFTRAMLSRFAQQIQQGRRRVELLSIRAADERVLAAIADGLLVDEISSFSDAIGLAAETVYRSLASLTRCGNIIKTGRGQYTLPSDRS
jgi:CRP-like cAMP-binding protein